MTPRSADIFRLRCKRRPLDFGAHKEVKSVVTILANVGCRTVLKAGSTEPMSVSHLVHRSSKKYFDGCAKVVVVRAIFATRSRLAHSISGRPFHVVFHLRESFLVLPILCLSAGVS